MSNVRSFCCSVSTAIPIRTLWYNGRLKYANCPACRSMGFDLSEFRARPSDSRTLLRRLPMNWNYDARPLRPVILHRRRNGLDMDIEDSNEVERRRLKTMSPDRRRCPIKRPNILLILWHCRILITTFWNCSNLQKGTWNGLKCSTNWTSFKVIIATTAFRIATTVPNFIPTQYWRIALSK